MEIAAAAALVTAQQSSPRVTSLTGDIRHIPSFHSKVLGNDRNLIVYLPPDYKENPRRRYPVLYMGDGQNVMDGMTSFLPNKEWRADESAESLIRAGLIEPIIIVGIDNAGADRANEYLPTHGDLGPGFKGGGNADNYLKMLTQELKPMVDREFRTKPDAANTGLAGSSLGGIITLYAGLNHPDVFSKLAVVSPSIWWDHKVMVKQIDALTAKPKLKIWIDIGTKESETAEADANEAVAALERKGFQRGKDLAYYVDFGAHHNEDAWAGRFPMMLLFLFGRHG